MSGAAQGDQNTSQAVVSDSKADGKALQPTKQAGQQEEDDEFEDFPVEDWTQEEEMGTQATNTHLWEESWDDDDTQDDFSAQLKDELKKMGRA